MNKQNMVYLLGFSHGSEVKNPSATEETQEIQVQFLGQEDPLGEDMATHSSVPAWKNPMDRGAWQATIQTVSKTWTGLVTEHS